MNAKKHFIFRLSPEMRKFIESKAKKRAISMTQILEEYIQKDMEGCGYAKKS